MTISHNKKIFFVIILVTLACAASLAYLFIAIRDTNAKISQSENDADLEQKRQTALASMDSVIKDMATDIQKINTYFIHKEDIIHFIENIEAMAKDEHVEITINAVDTDPISKDTYKEYLKLKFETLGSWDATYKFLLTLEDQPYKLTFDRVTLTRRADITVGKSVIKQWSAMYEIRVLKLK